ncbi:MAG: sigma-54 dependent transcriptional regulator [Myxococcales bacterium]|nr:sigma-54 dependent transcriptional regulator [Myxococcales bacterium]
MQVLVVDDNRSVLEALQLLFVLHDLDVQLATSPAEALTLVRRGGIGVVVQDMNFTASATTGDEGAALFRAMRAQDPDLPVVLMTAWTDLEMAVALVREGADDYVAKPWDDRKLLHTVQQLMATRTVASARPVEADLAGLVYHSPQMHSVVTLALRVASADVPVLVTGPSGVGKEHIAGLLQANSPRREGPYVVVNAGAMPEELVSTELFGAEAGAYTGSVGLRRGRFETADGGTLFLDEIGNLSPRGQAALLRVLQSGELTRVGSNDVLSTDVRVVAATNADLHAEISAGRFRQDLFYRLAVVEIRIPSLAERPDDIEPLAEHFLAEAGLPAEALDGTARRALRNHSWPGNVRELRSAVQRAVLVREGQRIGAADLGLVERVSPGEEDDPEAAALHAALASADVVVSRAAEALGLSRQAVYRRMERLGVRVQRKVKR